jgi:hypothetical protein
VLNPHWDGATLDDRSWYVVGWLFGLGISIGLLLLVDYLNFQRWLSRTGAGLRAIGVRARRAYG